MNNSQSKRKPYVRDVKKDWWLKNRFYSFYMLREFTCVFAAIYVVILLWGLLRLSQGQVAFEGWLNALHSPVAIVFHILALIAMLYHAKTWFALAPKATRLFKGEELFPEKPIVLSQYIALAVVFMVVLAIFII
ncbi:fumarate reductase subunit C [Dongshaea marina]|uniref:fumarate reductase subunit C n=1 Tax=Dongshaea marina TaxID=2047966 RepID=UPI000D3E4A1A|nr:fumarate reductase subunit C [Dongshaea marina]